jgi:3'-5' exoribonuclease
MNNQHELEEPIIHPIDDEDIPQNIPILPRIYRIVELSYSETSVNQIRYLATIFHAHAVMRVTWVTNKHNPSLIQGNLVSPRWLGKTCCENGAIRISRLVAMECPEHWVNLFQTIPHEWVKDRVLIERAAKLMQILPCTTRYIFNCNYWQGERLMNICNPKDIALLIDATYL